MRWSSAGILKRSDAEIEDHIITCAKHLILDKCHDSLCCVTANKEEYFLEKFRRSLGAYTTYSQLHKWRLQFILSRIICNILSLPSLGFCPIKERKARPARLSLRAVLKTLTLYLIVILKSSVRSYIGNLATPNKQE